MTYESRKQNSKLAVFWSKRKRPFGFWIKALEPETNIWCHNFKPLYCNFPFFVCCTQRKDPACHKKCNLLLQVSLSFNLGAHGNKKTHGVEFWGKIAIFRAWRFFCQSCVVNLRKQMKQQSVCWKWQGINTCTISLHQGVQAAVWAKFIRNLTIV